ncbi:MAG: hypothetical protein JRI36_00430 [Deltaproteobacteria bacterium]|nr:hypothetical protein [Deltaproteobacteria bacterium]
MKGQQDFNRAGNACARRDKATKVALWWLRNYDAITHFWRGFSWVWVIGVLMYVITGSLDLARAMVIIFVVGIIANSGIYCSIRAISAHLKQLEDGPEKQEAYDLMIKIIRARVLNGA